VLVDHFFPICITPEFSEGTVVERLIKSVEVPAI
jgi:hypothetical protein